MTASAEPRPEGRRWTRGRFVLAALAVLVVAGSLGAAGLWKVSASPQFCHSCHIMEPYVTSWQASKHRTVECVQCHYPPGFRDTLRVKFQAVTQVAKWATGTYSSKPYAEVEDASCLRSGCHAAAQLEGKGTLTSARGIKFDHRPHLDPARAGRQLRCTTCHSQVVVENHVEVSRTACFTCHFKGRKTGRELAPVAGCVACHDVPQRDLMVGSVRFNHREVVQRGVDCQKCHLNVVQGQGEAPRERCWTCHNQAEKIARYGEPGLLHDVHVTRHPIECTRCHDEITHRLPPPLTTPTASDSRSVPARTASAAAAGVDRR
ncbi:MAG TPA: NapC/NirT family cytochrome c [Methylomirabilota bacterium]|nr:NapC/NirT family cytochrome c [Methylomirabilota bacterium]